MRQWSLLLALLLGIWGAGCTEQLAVKSDYDRGVDFGKLGTFSWDAAARGDRIAKAYRRPFLDSKIRAAIERELAGKGWLRVASE